MLKCSSLALLACLSCSPSFANIEFYGDNNAHGDPVGVLTDSFSTTINMKNGNGNKSKWSSGWNNDKIRSIKLKSVSQGTIIELFDNPDAKTNDDWLQITVKKSAPVLVIPHLEQKSYENEYYKLTYHKDNGLNGKVSNVKVKPASQLTTNSKIMKNIMGDNFAYWKNKNGMAHEFKEGSRNYRFWKPDITVSQDNTVHVSFKVDHIKGGGQLDQHVNVYISFNSQGAVTNFQSLDKSDITSIQRSLSDKTYIVSTNQCNSGTKIDKANCIIDLYAKNSSHANAIKSRSKKVAQAVISAL